MAHFARLMMLTQTGKLEMRPLREASVCIRGVLAVGAKTSEKIVDLELLLIIQRVGH